MSKKTEVAEPAPPTGADITRGAGSKPGFRADGTPYPGIDPVTGEVKAVTLPGLKEMFGESKGVQFYNAIAVAGFNGVPNDRRPLNILSLKEEYGRQDLSPERAELRRLRRERVYAILAGAGLPVPDANTPTKE